MRNASFQRLLESLVHAVRSRAGVDVHDVGGDLIATFYDYDTPPRDGAVASVGINLTLIAEDMERELS